MTKYLAAIDKNLKNVEFWNKLLKRLDWNKLNMVKFASFFLFMWSVKEIYAAKKKTITSTTAWYKHLATMNAKVTGYCNMAALDRILNWLRTLKSIDNVILRNDFSTIIKTNILYRLGATRRRYYTDIY